MQCHPCLRVCLIFCLPAFVHYCVCGARLLGFCLRVPVCLCCVHVCVCKHPCPLYVASTCHRIILIPYLQIFALQLTLFCSYTVACYGHFCTLLPAVRHQVSYTTCSIDGRSYPFPSSAVSGTLQVPFLSQPGPFSSVPNQPYSGYFYPIMVSSFRCLPTGKSNG